MEDMIYGMMEALVSVVSCLLLLVAMVKRYRMFGMDVFTISGTMSVLAYTYFIGKMWVKYMSPFPTLSMMRVMPETALVIANIFLLMWFCRLAKVHYEAK